MEKRTLNAFFKSIFRFDKDLEIHKILITCAKHATLRLIALAILSLLILNCSSEKDIKRGRIMPGGSVPTKLVVLNIPSNLSWEERNMLTCFQGLINRIETRIYYSETEQDKFWLNYYSNEFNIEIEEIANTADLLKLFSKEIDGYVLYDLKNPHSLNIATTIGSLNNTLPVAKELESLIREIGLEKADEVKLNNRSRLDVYKDALINLLPQCNQNILAALCVHTPHWTTSTFRNRDYIIANKIFSFDLSSSERDKTDYYLTKEIYACMEEGTVIMGWHCVRDKEHEAIGLSSEFGHYGMCNLHTSNLTVHSSIPLPDNMVFSQRIIDQKELNVEDKIYIAFMATDGDASWFMNDLVLGDWADPAHGHFKYNWGFLPLAYDLMPGTVKYYLENMKQSDYFVAGPAGATYTYPYLHPEPSKFLRLSDEYMKKCGLTTVHMTNWNDRDWWQEVNIPEFYEDLQTYLPNSIGFVRGMGESAFEEHFLGNGKPYIFCGEGIHRGDDVYKTIKDFIDACPNRPLFIYSLVNHSIPIGEIKNAMDKFDNKEVSILHLDELLLMADKAYQEGKITDELYPEKSGIKEILKKEALKAWPKFIANLTDINKLIAGDEKEYKLKIEATPVGIEPIVAGDFLAFTSVWNSMTLVKLAMESQGYYVNNKNSAAEHFIEEFKKAENISVVSELNRLWNSWHDESVNYEQAKALAVRLYKLAQELDKIIQQ